MSKRILLAVMLHAALFIGVAHGAESRWYNFAEDSELRYYLDKKSVVARPGNLHIFWVKTIPKDREYFRREYNLNNLASILTSYEIDCSNATYRVRQTLMLDKNRKELSKTQPAGSDASFEPIPPESSIELAQEYVCPQEEEGAESEDEQPQAVQPAEPQPQEQEQGESAAEPEISLQ